MPITYNNFSLDSASIMPSTIGHNQAPTKNIGLVKILRRDGSKLTYTDYSNKIINIDGYLTLGGQEDFEQVADDFKNKILSPEVANLDISYANGTRRYNATAKNVAITRDTYNIDWAPYSIEFLVNDPPFGQDIVTTRAKSESNLMISTLSSSIYLEGSAEPKPTIQIDITSGSYLTDVEFKNTTTFTRVQMSNSMFETGDVLTVDCDNLAVEKNYNPIDYVGTFPKFQTGWNGYDLNFYKSASVPGGTIQDILQEVNVDEDIIYDKYFIAQSFKPTTTNPIPKIDILLRKVGLPQNLIVEIQSDNSNKPSNSIIVNGTVTITPSQISDTNSWITANFNSVNLQSGSLYHIVLKTPTTPLAQGHGYWIRRSNNDQYTNGNQLRTTDSGSIWELRPVDSTFKTYYLSSGSISYKTNYSVDYIKRYL